MSFKTFALAAGISVTALTTPANAATFEQTVTDSYARGMVNWDGNGNMMYRWAVINVDGKLAMCGVYSTAGSSKYARFNKAALAQAKLIVDGKPVMHSLSFFRSSPNENRATEHVGDTATCKVTRADTPSRGVPIDVQFKEGSYRLR